MEFLKCDFQVNLVIGGWNILCETALDRISLEPINGLVQTGITYLLR